MTSMGRRITIFLIFASLSGCAVAVFFGISRATRSRQSSPTTYELCCSPLYPPSTPVFVAGSDNYPASKHLVSSYSNPREKVLCIPAWRQLLSSHPNAEVQDSILVGERSSKSRRRWLVGLRIECVYVVNRPIMAIFHSIAVPQDAPSQSTMKRTIGLTELDVGDHFRLYAPQLSADPSEFSMAYTWGDGVKGSLRGSIEDDGSIRLSGVDER